MPNKFYFYLVGGADCYIERSHGCFRDRAHVSFNRSWGRLFSSPSACHCAAAQR